MCIRVLIVDDHKILREGVHILLEKDPGIEVVGEAYNGENALELVEQHLPDVVLMDLNMPNLNGVDATQRILSQFPGISILILSTLEDRHLVLETIRAGAKGFVTKSTISGNELVDAVRAVASGRKYFSESITESLINDYIDERQQHMQGRFTHISPREREVLQLLSEGKNAKEIAFTLDVSPKTVDAHRQKIMKKLNIGTVAELTKFAIREGLTTLE
jgi:DNA-binding NarL/FixJ family response regulator